LRHRRTGGAFEQCRYFRRHTTQLYSAGYVAAVFRHQDTPQQMRAVQQGLICLAACRAER